MSRFPKAQRADNTTHKNSGRGAAVAVQLYSGCVSHAAGGPCCLCLPPPHYHSNPSTHTHTSHLVQLAVMYAHPLTLTAELLFLFFCLFSSYHVSVPAHYCTFIPSATATKPFFKKIFFITKMSSSFAHLNALLYF